MQKLGFCALGTVALCALASPSLAVGPMLFDLGMEYGDNGTGACFEVWNYSATDPGLREPVAVNGGSAVLSKNWTDQFWMAGIAGDDTGYREVQITKSNASEAWVTRPLAVELDILDMPLYALVGSIAVSITTRDANEAESVVELTFPSDAWSSPTSAPVVIGPVVLDTAYPAQFDADEQVTKIRLRMTVIPEPLSAGLVALGGLALLQRRRRP